MKSYSTINVPDGHVEVTVRNKKRVIKFPEGITLKQWDASWDRWQDGAMIQNAFHYLSLNDREFLISGITPEEWKRIFGEE